MVDATVPDIALEPDKTVKKVCFIFIFHSKLFTHKISSTKSNIAKVKFYLSILYTKRKTLKINGIAYLPGSRVLIGFPPIKCVFSCLLN